MASPLFFCLFFLFYKTKSFFLTLCIKHMATSHRSSAKLPLNMNNYFFPLQNLFFFFFNQFVLPTFLTLSP